MGWVNTRPLVCGTPSARSADARAFYRDIVIFSSMQDMRLHYTRPNSTIHNAATWSQQQTCCFHLLNVVLGLACCAGWMLKRNRLCLKNANFEAIFPKHVCSEKILWWKQGLTSSLSCSSLGDAAASVEEHSKSKLQGYSSVLFNVINYMKNLCKTLEFCKIIWSIIFENKLDRIRVLRPSKSMILQ